jgi:hypothetical protein
MKATKSWWNGFILPRCDFRSELIWLDYFLEDEWVEDDDCEVGKKVGQY